LIERATAVRESARAAGDAAEADQTLARAATLATDIGGAADRIRDAADARASLTEAGIKGLGRPQGVALARKLAQTAGVQVGASINTFVISSTARDLTKAVEGLSNVVEASVKERWREWAQEQLRGVGSAAYVLERPLSRGPFAATIERARGARTQLRTLAAKDVPTTNDVRLFIKQRDVLAKANAEIEDQVPKQFRTALVQCASPEGLRPTELPEGFIDWIESVKAAAYFKVTMTS
jgi:hypothetical protein